MHLSDLNLPIKKTKPFRMDKIQSYSTNKRHT